MVDTGGGEIWIQLGGLALTIIATTASSTAFIMNRINSVRAETNVRLDKMDDDINASRMAAFEEYQAIRKEIAEVASITRKEFGETIAAIREKVTEVELWTRDQLTETRHTLYSGMDQRHAIAMEKVERVDSHVRQLELFTAAKQGFIPKPD